MNIFTSLFLIFLALHLALSANWYQSGGYLYKDGQAVYLKGVSWFGLETTDRAPHGIWTSNVYNGQTYGHSIAWFMQKIKDLGFNAVRIPLSPQGMSTDANLYPTASWATNWDPSLTNGWAVLNSMLSCANNVGLFVLIDYQTCNDNQIGGNLPGSPTNCPGYSLNDWINDLTTLANLAKSYPNVFGLDIFNEPHDIPWSQWQGYAQQAIAQLYSVNPNLVYFVEGINGNVPGDGTGTCWGENLYYAGSQPVVPAGVPLNKIVYSPHIYDECDNDWPKCFGYLNGGQNTIIVGEFGYDSQSSYDLNTFMPNFQSFMGSSLITGWFYWCINANDPQLGYLDPNDSTWCTVVGEKINRFRQLGVYPQSYITSSNPPSLC